MPGSRQARPHARRLARSLRAAGLTLLSLAPGLGCGREFFRQWADQDVTEAVFEKSRDPRWRIPTLTVEPPAMSRFADWSDPDRPAAPPDDYPAEALSPMPQLPHIRLLTPMEGTGYLDMLNAGARYDAPPDVAERVPEEVDEPSLERGTTPLPPPPVNPAPFGGERTPGPVLPDGEGPRPLGVPVRPDMRPPGAEDYSGARPGTLSPNNTGGPIGPPPAGLDSPLSGTSTSSPRDPGVQAASFQQLPVTPSTSDPGGVDLPAVTADPLAPDPGQDVDPLRLIPPGTQPLDRPGSEAVQDPNVPFTRPDAGPDQLAEIRQARASFASVLSPAYMDVNQATAAALPPESRPYILGPAQALQLALINSRGYQTAIENIYLQSLNVTLARFQFEPQVYAGVPAVTQPFTGFPAGGTGATSFLYRTREAPGGQASTLSLTSMAGFGKLFSFGGRLAAGFANTTVFNFVGLNPSQPNVQSSLPLSFVQPFLRGGGRAVTLEPLTLAERQLLYQVRSFARFRQAFMVQLLAGPQAGVGLGAQVAQADGNVGFLQVLQQYQLAENTRRIVAAFERAKEIYTVYARGGASSGISQLQVDQIDQQLQTNRISLIQAQTNYRIALDNYKIQIGLPPDTPLIIDRALIAGFSDVFRAINEWEREPDHDPSELNEILGGLPALQNINLDGRPLFDLTGPRVEEVYAKPELQEEFLLVAERIALENRLDLMNERALLYDAWRPIAVQANSLLPVFTVSYNGNLVTPPTTSNPFGFDSQSLQNQLSLQAELPLIRVVERNNFRASLINYQRQRRALMQYEDNVKNGIRQQIRQLILALRSYEINKTNLLLALRQRDQALQQIVAPPDQGAGGQQSQAIQTVNFITSIGQVLNTQNQLVSGWVQYQSIRLGLYRDLGIMPYDEWEAYYELFPADAGRGAVGAGADGRTSGGAVGLDPEAPEAERP